MRIEVETTVLLASLQRAEKGAILRITKTPMVDLRASILQL